MIQVKLIPATELKNNLESPCGNNNLCYFYYDSDPPPQFLLDSPPPVFWIPMEQYGPELLVEAWLSSSPVEFQVCNDIKISCTDSMIIFGMQREVQPGKFDEGISEDVFKSAFQIQRKTGYPHLVRIWNYVPRINTNASGLEVYKRFCIGRHLAFEEYDSDFRSTLCSSSALGVNEDRCSSIFLASKESGVHIENPRQVSAFHYPDQYGPKSPSFARATVKKIDDSKFLFISGTASIVGHETRHVGKLEKQIEETSNNINALLEKIQEKEITGSHKMRALVQKVYVRNSEDIPFVQSYLKQVFDEENTAIYLHGDICRHDLLLEIEGVWVDDNK